MIPVLGAAAFHWPWQPPAWSGDYAQYLLHARAILEGRGYSDIGYIYNPAAWTVGPPAYPPGLPLTLVPIVAVAGENMAVLRLFSIGCLVLLAWFAYKRLSRATYPIFAAVSAALAALSIELQLGTIAPISDLPFAALLWWFVLAGDGEEAWDWRRVAVVTFLGFALLSYRVAGVAVIPALAVYAFLNWRRDRGRSMVPVVIWCLAGLAALGAGLVENPYADGVSSVKTSLATQLSILKANYQFTLFEAQLYPFGINRADDIYHVVATLFAGIGGVILLWRMRKSLLVWVTGSYLAMLALAPVADGRYAWPLFPIVGLALAVGLHFAMTRLRLTEQTSIKLVTVVFGLVAIGAMRHTFSEPRPYAITGTQESRAVYSWLARRQQEEPMRLMFYNPRVVALKTGVPTMGLTQRDEPGQLVAIDESRISHLIAMPDSLSDCLQRAANHLPVKYPERFELEYENPAFRVYRVLPADQPFKSDFKRLLPTAC